MASCEFPETQDEFNGPQLAVWALFAADEEPKVFLTEAMPFEPGDTLPRKSFVHSASVTLSCGDTAVTLAEQYDGYSYFYAPSDSFKLEAERSYTLAVSSEAGSFSKGFTVPPKPSFSISPDTAFFDNSSSVAFVLTLSVDEVGEYAVEIELLEDEGYPLPDSIWWSASCPELRWKGDVAPQEIRLGWCHFFMEGCYNITVCARDEEYSRYLDHLEYDYDDEGDDYRPPTGGDGYIGVVGACSQKTDTVWVFIR